jgi:hypothetical protein
MAIAYDAQGKALGAVKIGAKGIAAGKAISYVDGKPTGLVDYHGSGGRGAELNVVTAGPAPAPAAPPAAAPAPKARGLEGDDDTLPYDPATAAAIQAARETAGAQEKDTWRQQRDYLDESGFQRDAQGNPVYGGADGKSLVFNFSDPLSKAYSIQKSWMETKRGHYQGVGNQLYSGAYQNQRRRDDEGETTDFGRLLAEGGRQIGAFDSARKQITTGTGAQVGQLRGNWASTLAQAPREDNLGSTQPSSSAPGPGQTPKSGTSRRQLRSYVKNGWFYRESSTEPGKMLRIRKAS